MGGGRQAQTAPPRSLKAERGSRGVEHGAVARTPLRGVNYWPGFVDALSTMLLVIIFLLSVFMLAQFFLSREVTGKDTALAKLNQQIEELTSLLALERTAEERGRDARFRP